MSDATTSNVLPMGLGCLSLIPKLDAETLTKRGDREWWQESLESGLGSLPSVTDLEVRITSIYAGQDLSSASLPADFEDVSESYINLNLEEYGMPSKGSYVKFDVTIPRRMQAELCRRRLPERPAERIELHIVYGFYGPVSFIRPLEIDGLTGWPASEYLVLVREFLIRELARVDSPIRVSTIGPSPFHADITLCSSSGVSGDWSHAWERAPYGYDEIKFFYDPERLTPQDAYRSIADALVDPFANYYFLVRSKYSRLERAITINKMANDLIRVHNRGGLRGWFIKTLRSGKMARELLLATLTAKYADNDERAYLKERFLNRISTANLPTLAELSVHEVEATYVDRLALAEEIATTLEGGRVSQYEVLVLSASTLLGAMAGAIAALVAH